jgi:hypothetical protein
MRERDAVATMVDHDEEESPAPLAQFPLHNGKTLVKLDKGFARGTYGVTIEYDELAAAQGFRAAAKAAGAYAQQLRDQLSRFSHCTVGPTEDPSRDAGPGRKRDLESTFLYFPLEYGDGHWHDREMTERFRIAVLRANQAGEQDQARAQTQRRQTRQERFRQQLEDLLSGPAYAGHLDDRTRERLTQDVLRLAFPERGVEF